MRTNKHNLIHNLFYEILGDPRITQKVKDCIGKRTDWISTMLDSPHTLDVVGVWRIYGEDPNPETGGTDHMPDLGYVCGPYWEVLNAAVELPQFFARGAGGKLVRVTYVPRERTAIYTASMTASMSAAKAHVTEDKVTAKKLNAMASIAELSKEISRCADKLEAETELLRIEHELAFQALSSLPGGEHIVKALKLEAANRLSDL